MNGTGGPFATEQPMQFQRVVFVGRHISDADIAAAVDKELVIRAYSGQTTNMMELQNSSGTLIGGFSPTGALLAAGGGVVAVTKLTTIAPAAVLTLRNSPVEVVPAAGAGFVNEFVSAVLLLDYTAPAYTEATANLAFKYIDGSGIQVSQTVEMTGFITLTGDAMTSAMAKIDVIATKAECENKAIVLHNLGAAEFGNAGGSTLRVRVTYRVHPTGW